MDYLKNTDRILGFECLTVGKVAKMMKTVMNCDSAKDNSNGNFNDFVLLSDHQCEKFENNLDFTYSRERLRDLKMAINNGSFTDRDGNKISIDVVQDLYSEVLKQEKMEKIQQEVQGKLNATKQDTQNFIKGDRPK